jgi:hypothetical protein
MDLASSIALFPWHGTPWNDKEDWFISLDGERKTPSGKHNGYFLAACAAENHLDAERDVFSRRHLNTR